MVAPPTNFFILLKMKTMNSFVCLCFEVMQFHTFHIQFDDSFKVGQNQINFSQCARHLTLSKKAYLPEKIGGLHRWTGITVQ